MRKGKERRGSRPPRRRKNATICCGITFSYTTGAQRGALTQHFRECHPKISKAGFVGDLNSIKDEKLRKFIYRKKNRIKLNRPYTR